MTFRAKVEAYSRVKNVVCGQGRHMRETARTVLEECTRVRRSRAMQLDVDAARVETEGVTSGAPEAIAQIPTEK